jgi:hypothetical protein
MAVVLSQKGTTLTGSYSLVFLKESSNGQLQGTFEDGFAAILRPNFGIGNGVITPGQEAFFFCPQLVAATVSADLLTITGSYSSFDCFIGAGDSGTFKLVRN